MMGSVVSSVSASFIAGRTFSDAGAGQSGHWGQRVPAHTVENGGFITMTGEAGNRCPECNVRPHDAHLLSCDVARCLWTGTQRLSCRRKDHKSCGEDIWYGEWPGYQECRQYSLWCYWRPSPLPGIYSGVFEPCDESHHQAMPDLITLESKGTWDRESRSWILSQHVKA